MLTKLTERRWIMMHASAVPCSKAQFTEMWATIPETRNQIKLYGKTHDVPRFQKLFGDASYSFSGITLQPEPEIPALVERCLAFARDKYPAFEWTGALVNYYPDGNSCIGAHSDSEADLVKGAPICSFSFGGERALRIKYRGKGADVLVRKADVPCPDGSALIMGGDMQREFTHELPRTKRLVRSRINVTVRSFVRGGSAKRTKVEKEEEE